ncbi:MAG: alkaline phosphatase family protein, partial [Aeromicrobium erythreum]
AQQKVRTCGEPTDIVFPTMLERLRERGLTTGSVLSKDYLYSVFGTRATYRWEPFPLLPVTNHALDVFTMSALRTMISEADPHLVFANFGDIDRFGHSDLTGSNLQVLRRTALTSTDAQIGSFVSWLRTRSTWSSTTVVVLADHSMDWSDPDRLISLTRAFKGNALLEGQVAIADNGGADVISFLGRSADRSRALAEATRIALATPGVLSVRTTAQLRLGAKAGDLVVYCKSGYRFSDPDLYSNPIRATTATRRRRPSRSSSPAAPSDRRCSASAPRRSTSPRRSRRSSGSQPHATASTAWRGSDRVGFGTKSARTTRRP